MIVPEHTRKRSRNSVDDDLAKRVRILRDLQDVTCRLIAAEREAYGMDKGNPAEHHRNNHPANNPRNRLMGKRDIPLLTPEVLKPLLEPGKRYRGAHGGRASGKSHFFAELIVEQALRLQATTAARD